MISLRSRAAQPNAGSARQSANGRHRRVGLSIIALITLCGAVEARAACPAFPAGTNTNDQVVAFLHDFNNPAGLASLHSPLSIGLATVAEGHLVYNRTSKVLQLCNDTSWVSLASSAATPAGNDGSIQFKSGTAFAADATNLHWDDTNNFLGIGTASPVGVMSMVRTDDTAYSSTTQQLGAEGTVLALANLSLVTDSFAGISFTNRASNAGEARIVAVNRGSNNTDLSFVTENTTRGERMRILGNGNVGIGTTAPSAKIHVIDNNVGTVAANAQLVDLTAVPASPTSAGYTGVYGLGSSASNNLGGFVRGVYGDGIFTGNNVLADVYGVAARAYYNAGGAAKNIIAVSAVARNGNGSSTHGTVTSLIGVDVNANNYSDGGVSTGIIGTRITGGNYGEATIPYIRGVNGLIEQNNSSGTIETATAFYADLTNIAGTVNTYYGLYVPDDSAGAANTWAVYTAGAMRSYFGGNVGIGTTSPLARLHVSTTGASAPATSGAVPSAGTIARFETITSNGVVDIGNDGGNTALWLQAYNRTNMSVPWRLLLNPNGGNVGIGTTSPQSALHVPDGKYAQFEDFNAGAPLAADCDADTERGRQSIDTTNFRLYICMGATRGWDYVALTN